MKLKEIAHALGCELKGDPELEIIGLASIETARPGDLTFLSNARYQKHLATTRASAIIVDNDANLPAPISALLSPSPYLSFAQALALFHAPMQHPRGIHPTAVIAPGARIGQNVSVGPFSVIDDRVTVGNDVTILSHCSLYSEAEIGDHSFIHSHCVIREKCRLGRRVVLQNHVVVGSDGFGYARHPDASWQKIPQTGTVVIADDVEIGAGAIIDRASIGATTIGRGTKIDNLVQVGHSSTVGEDTLLCAQVGLAGSTHVGNEVILGGQVGVAGHLKIGNRVVATAQTGIPNSVSDDTVISGYPAIPNRDWLRSAAIFARLPALQRELRDLRRRLQGLEGDPKPEAK